MHCDEEDHCAGNPCHNGDCISVGNSYRCNCHEGFNGPDCQIDINECRNFPCANGRCENTYGSYK